MVGGENVNQDLFRVHDALEPVKDSVWTWVRLQRPSGQERGDPMQCGGVSTDVHEHITVCAWPCIGPAVLQPMQGNHQAADEAPYVWQFVGEVEQKVPNVRQGPPQGRQDDHLRAIVHTPTASFTPAARSRGVSRSTRSAATTAAGATRWLNNQEASSPSTT